MNSELWPAAGSADTELGVLLEPEVGHGATEVYARIQARGGEADQGAGGKCRAGLARSGCARDSAAQLGEGVCGRSAACLSGPRAVEARAGGDRAVEARSDEAQGRAGHPKKSRGLLREGIDVKFGFIAKHRGIWPAAWLCGALGVSRGGFYAWLTRPRSPRAKSDEELAAKMRASFLASDRTYGAKRVLHDLLADRVSSGLHRIKQFTLLQALRARPRRRRLPPDLGERQANAVAPNVLDRAFEAPAPNRKWIADFTYIWTAEGWLYVAAVVDLFSRRVVGWSMSATMAAQLVTDALVMAIWRRRKTHAP